MNESEERRAAARIPINLAVTYRIGDGPDVAATVDNLSRNGMLLVAGDDIGEGKRLRITFVDPQQRLHTVIGEVVRSAPEGRVGVSLVHIEQRTLEYVRDVLGVP